MQARRRSPGDGPRSKISGMGLRAGRISPENSSRAQSFYNQDYRGFSRGFSRGPAKRYTPPPPPPPPPPRRADVLMEAGRLAAEYLVSQGVLPAHLLPGRWANGSSKGYAGEFQNFRLRDKGNLPTQSDGRTSALARLGHAGHEVGVPGRDDEVWPMHAGNSDVPLYGRRRFADEQPGSRTRGRRRAGSFRGYGSDKGRENGRLGGQSADRPTALAEMPESEEDIPNFHGDKQADTEGEEAQKVSDAPLPARSDENAGDSGSELENFEFPGTSGVEESSLVSRKDQSAMTDDAKLVSNNLEEVQKEVSVGGKNGDTALHVDAVDEKLRSSSDETEKKSKCKDAAIEDCKLEDSRVTKEIGLDNSGPSMGSDLMQFCNVAKVPTRARSSLKRRPSSQVDSGAVGSLFSSSENKPTVDAMDVADMKDQTASNSISGCSSDSQPQGPGLTESDVPAGSSIRDTDEFHEPDPVIYVDQGKGAKLESISDGSSLHQEELEKYPPGFGDMNNEIVPQDHKASFDVRSVSLSPLRDSNAFKDLGLVGSKRPREWPSPRNSLANDYFLIQNFGAHDSSSNGNNLSSDVEMVDAVEPPPMLDGATMMPSKEPQIETSTEPVLSNCDHRPQDEKQLLPCSFQLFDVNFPVEIADAIPSHVSSEFSASDVENEASQHVGSLLRHICNGIHNQIYPCNDFFNETTGSGKWTGYDGLMNINTIDAGVFHTALLELFSGLPLVRKLYQARNTKLSCLVCIALSQEAQTTYSSLEDLLDHTRNADCLPKVHKGYGSAITDLLEMDLLNNSSSSAAINDLHSDVYLGFGEVLPCYDDPFYLSLEEISVDMPEI